MIQYTQCADPTESAARRERLRLAEEKGELEEAASLMIQARLETENGTLTGNPREEEELPLTERIPATLRLGPMAPLSLYDEEGPSAERIPAALRLGPVEIPQNRTAMQITTTKEKRKPGRPPAKKRTITSPQGTKASSSRKRKIQQEKPPLAHRRLLAEPEKGQTSRARADKPRSTRKTTRTATSSANSDDQPICNMIPKETRRKMDFQDPSHLVP